MKKSSIAILTSKLKMISFYSETLDSEPKKMI